MNKMLEFYIKNRKKYTCNTFTFLYHEINKNKNKL